MARTSWITLLGYLAFIGVASCSPSRTPISSSPHARPSLTLVDVSIPTASFFIFAPILAALAPSARSRRYKVGLKLIVSDGVPTAGFHRRCPALLTT